MAVRPFVRPRYVQRRNFERLRNSRRFQAWLEDAASVNSSTPDAMFNDFLVGQELKYNELYYPTASGPIPGAAPSVAPSFAQAGTENVATAGVYTARGGGTVVVTSEFELNQVQVSSNTTYTPQMADYGDRLVYIETATETGGTEDGITVRSVDLGPVVYALPVVVGLADVSETINASPLTVNLSAGFTSDSTLTYTSTVGTVTGSNLELDLSSVISTTVSVTATDADGQSVSDDFAFVVTAVSAIPAIASTVNEPILLIDGDSIMDYNATRLIAEQYVGHQYYKPEGYDQSRAGDSTLQILEGVQNVVDRIVPNKTVVVVGPTAANQGTGSSTFAEISGQQQQIYDAYLNAGAIVVAIPTLPDEDSYNNNTERDALKRWVEGHETGDSFTYDGTPYSVSARANFYAIDLGTFDRGQSGSAAYPAGAFNPYTMKNDQTHPNGEGSRYLGEKVAVMLDSLVTSDVFTSATNLLSATDEVFGGTATASNTGVTGNVPTNWNVSRSGSSTNWVCSKDGNDNLVASVTNAGNNSVLSVGIDVTINGVAGDVYDMVVEADVSGNANGFKALKIVAEDGTSTQGNASFYPDRTTLRLRSNSAVLTGTEASKTFTVQALVEPGATCSITFKRATVYFVENLASVLSISGTPTTVAEVGTAYSFVPTVTGGTTPYVFDLASGTLPAGLSLNTSTGEISGTPTGVESATGLALRVTDDNSTALSLAVFDIDVIANGAPQISVAPVLSNTSPVEGSEVTVGNGTWTNSPVSYEYRWKLSGNLQAGETTNAYTPPGGTAALFLTAEVRATNASGSSVWVTTAESDTIASGLPVNTAVPTLSDTTPTEGVEVTVTNGTWTNSPSSYEYRWTYNDVVQSGQTTAAHTPVTAGVGAILNAEVRATNSVGTSDWVATADSAAIAAAAGGSSVTWDTAIPNGTDLAFSNGDRTVTMNHSSGNRAIMSAESSTTGKIYFEVVPTDMVRIGVCDEDVTATGSQNAGTDVVFWQGTVINNGTSTGVGGSFADGDVVQVAMDIDAGLVWMRANNTGDWNGDAGADPATGLLGRSTAALDGTQVHAYARGNVGGVATINGTVATQTYTAPSGFGEIG